MLNCAKESKLYTVLFIDNSPRRGLLRFTSDEEMPAKITMPECASKPGYKTFDVNEFFEDAIYTEANAIEVGKRFSLPGFAEIDQWIKKKHPELVQNAA